MFGLFKKADPLEKLNQKYKKLLEESHKLSHSDRKAADLKAQEAEEVLTEIERLKKEQG